MRNFNFGGEKGYPVHKNSSLQLCNLKDKQIPEGHFIYDLQSTRYFREDIKLKIIINK